MPRVSRPELVINYAPELDLHLTFAHAQGYAGTALPEYRFEMRCCLRQLSGSFTYSVSDLCFDLQSFAKFSEELQGMRQGLREEAALKGVGEMTVLRLEGNSRALKATLCIHESIAARLATLNASLNVDYDLFVNKLRGELERFLEEGQI